MDLPNWARSGNESQFGIEPIPCLPFSVVQLQWFFLGSTEQKCLNHAQEWKLIGFSALPCILLRIIPGANHYNQNFTRNGL